jgi:DNA polymerase III subunit epsilon
MQIVAIDFETADKRNDSACALGLSVVQDGNVVDSWYSLIRPPRQNVMFSYVHGLYWDDVKDAPEFAEVWTEALPYLEGADFIAAHNAGFDRSVLYGCCRAFAVARPKQGFLCTVQLARRYLDLERNNLAAVSDHLNIELDHHHALSDALACGEIVAHMQREGHDITACELRAYKEKQNG